MLLSGARPAWASVPWGLSHSIRCRNDGTSYRFHFNEESIPAAVFASVLRKSSTSLARGATVPIATSSAYVP